MRLSKEIKAAFFVLSTILLFIFGFNYLKGSSILDKQKTIYAVYDEVDGLLVGANVMINGLSIGNVTELDFLPNSTKIIVTLKVKDKLNFSSKSTASIYETGVLGGLAISIEPLFERESIVKTGDTLMSSVRPGLTELINRQIEPLSRQLQSTITSVDSIFTGASNVLCAHLNVASAFILSKISGLTFASGSICSINLAKLKTDCDFCALDTGDT